MIVQLVLMVVLGCLMCEGYPQQTDPRQYLNQLTRKYIPEAAGQNTYDLIRALAGQSTHTPQSEHPQEVEHPHQVEEHHQDSNEGTTTPKVGVLMIQPHHEKVEAMDYKKADRTQIEEEADSTMVLSKVIKTSRVEEVYEDLMTQKIRRLIKEDKEVKTELMRNKAIQEVGSDYIIKNILGGIDES